MDDNVEQKQTEDSIPRLRTFKSDVAESMKTGKQSLTRMIIAEKTRSEQGGETKSQIRGGLFLNNKTIFVAFGAILIMFAVGIGTFLFFGNTKEEPAAPSLPAWSPIFTEVDGKITLEKFDEREVQSAIREIKDRTAIPVNAILGITFVTETATPEGVIQERPVTTEEILSALPNDIPPQLARTLDAQFFFGLYAFKTTAPFLILQNRFYDGAFLGMLEWERFMLHDIAPLFFISPAGQERGFEDIVIKNTDVRAQKNIRGDIVLLYSFIDRKTIVITTNTDTLTEVVSRLRTPRPITR